MKNSKILLENSLLTSDQSSEGLWTLFFLLKKVAILKAGCLYSAGSPFTPYSANDEAERPDQGESTSCFWPS